MDRRDAINETITYMTMKTSDIILDPNKITQDFDKNFDVSIVIPFYKKLEAFKRVFPKNRKYFERNGIEVVIVLDCPDEKDELVEYVKEYPFINWKIAYNDKPHRWRNPTKPINVGIKHASKKYIMVCSPESEFYTDAILQFRSILEYYPGHYGIGTVCFADGESVNIKNMHRYKFLPYGSIMVEKELLFQIKGYDEALNKWGGDDDNIRARLELHGIKQLFLPEVKLVHHDYADKDGKERRKYKKRPLEIVEKFHYPKSTVVNDRWGEDFDNIIYDWQDNKYAEELLKKYLSQYLDYQLLPGALQKKYGIILLVPSYNEEKRITRFFNENSKYFDAIILLDDGSTDSTFELAQDERLILKLKKDRIEFNDLVNRNILLNVASFFKHDWICFIDADEILDPKFSNFASFTANKDIDSVLLNMIHLWDDENVFNASYPYTEKGLSFRFRMFRNIGHSQILSKTGKLHFPPVPYIGNSYRAPILIKHLGNLSKAERVNKYDFYKKEDTEQSQNSYEHLLQENIKKRNVQDISIAELKKSKLNF